MAETFKYKVVTIAEGIGVREHPGEDVWMVTVQVLPAGSMFTIEIPKSVADLEAEIKKRIEERVRKAYRLVGKTFEVRA